MNTHTAPRAEMSARILEKHRIKWWTKITKQRNLHFLPIWQPLANRLFSPQKENKNNFQKNYSNINKNYGKNDCYKNNVNNCKYNENSKNYSKISALTEKWTQLKNDSPVPPLTEENIFDNEL